MKLWSWFWEFLDKFRWIFQNWLRVWKEKSKSFFFVVKFHQVFFYLNQLFSTFFEQHRIWKVATTKISSFEKRVLNSSRRTSNRPWKFVLFQALSFGFRFSDILFKDRLPLLHFLEIFQLTLELPGPAFK